MTDSAPAGTAVTEADHVPQFPPPRDLPELEPFWDAAAAGGLALPRCPGCGRWQWYPASGCRCGFPDGPEWVPVRGTGVIHTFTRVERAFLPSGSTPPYTVALVDIDDAPGVRLVTNLVGPGADAPHIGDRVELSPTVFDTHTLPTFRLVDSDEKETPR
ncbi:Zn-ribbon domain-containing OB-fold protein [Rhodococcus sp. NPDC003322]